MPDYSGEERLSSSADLRTELEAMARQLDKAEREVDQRKIDLARAETRVADLREILIPEMMQEMGLKALNTVDGLEVKIDDNVYAKISREKEHDAFSWLDDNGHGGMIKRKVTVEFDRDQEEMVKDLVKTLRKTYPQTREEKKVEWQTLTAFVRRRLKEGESTPEDLFGIHVKPVATLKRSKK